MPELKPCPFCGGSAKIYASTMRTYPNHGKHYCYCEKCLASGPSFSDLENDGSSVFKAIEAWNRRDELTDVMTAKVKLRGCGLCKNEHVRLERLPNGFWHVVCDRYACDRKVDHYYDNPDEAVYQWNTKNYGLI